MHIVKQTQSLRIKKYDFDGEDEKLRHNALVPLIVRYLSAGSSGCGKSNVLIALLEHPNRLCFKNKYFYSKSL